MKDNTIINEIIIKAISDQELTTEEQNELKEWLLNESNLELFNNLKDKEYLRERLIEAHSINLEEDKKALDQKIANRAKVIHLRNWMRYAAAVIVLMIGSVTFYFLILRKNENKIVNQPTLAKANNDVLPGKYKAKLTLADGSFIVLDSVMIGKLAQQGGTQVMNKDGKLVYSEQGADGNEVLYNTLTTSRGQMYPIVLSDNSRIWLNSESSLKYPVAFVTNERRVEISGEAYFEIAHDASKPFIVSVNGTELKVLGTKFNVNAYTDEGTIRTTLLEGSVQVKKGVQQTTIKPGQQAQVADNAIKTINDVDVEQAVAWKNGLFQFNGDDIKAVLRQLGRWYDVDVTYQGVVPNRRFGGKISRGDNLSQVLKTLESNDVHFKLEGKTIIVTP